MAGPTNGIEHLRVVQTIGAARRVIEYWEHRPADGCWSTRVRARGPGERSEILSTVVRDPDGTRRRVAQLDGHDAYDHSDTCGDAASTELQLLRRIVADAGLRHAGTARVAGRTVQILTGPPDSVLLGMEDPGRSTAVADITTPPGAVMRILWDPVRRMPVRIATPRVVVTLDAAGRQRQAVPAMTMVFLTAEEVPATPAALRVFAPR